MQRYSEKKQLQAKSRKGNNKMGSLYNIAKQLMLANIADLRKCIDYQCGTKADAQKVYAMMLNDAPGLVERSYEDFRACRFEYTSEAYTAYQDVMEQIKLATQQEVATA